jgi:plastocyanin
MILQTASTYRMLILSAWAALFLGGATAAHATTHVIQFGGELGFVYSPSTLNVSVGDTVQWQGDFSMHPLSSTSVPNGAASFHNTAGSSFSYHVTVAGTYHYQCDIHFSIGMVGSFTAIVTGVENSQTSLLPAAFGLEQNFPNPFNPTTVLSYRLPVASKVNLNIYDILGRKIATLVDEVEPAGSHRIVWNASDVSSGIYFYRLQAFDASGSRSGAFIETKKLVVLK